MKQRPIKFLVLIALPASVLCGLVAGTLPSHAATTLPSTMPDGPTTERPAFAAMAYYDQNCAHCHGPQGTFYGPTLGQKLSDAQLIKVVDDMASGPGNAPLKADQLPVETAFHRALIMRVPFVSVTRMDADGKWAGEAMPDAKVTVFIGDKRIDAASDDANWSAQVPVGTKIAEVKITAELDGVTNTVKLAEGRYSNAGALPDLGARPK